MADLEKRAKELLDEGYHPKQVELDLVNLYGPDYARHHAILQELAEQHYEDFTIITVLPLTPKLLVKS